MASTGGPLLSLTLRPEVPMGAYQGLGYVCVLGAVEALRSQGQELGIGWPFDLVDAETNERLAHLRVQAGYNEGMFATCELLADKDAFNELVSDLELVSAGIEQRVDSWAEKVRAGQAVAGPLAPILSDYFDATPLLGHPAEAIYPNGNVMASGTFAGIDIWGRATLRTEEGRELEFAPEQASIRVSRLP